MTCDLAAGDSSRALPNHPSPLPCGKNASRCPVYKTQMRGPTYVFDAFLRTKAPAAKWVLAGVVLVMDIV